MMIFVHHNLLFLFFFTKLLTSGILSSTVVNAELVAKPITSVILLFISSILVIY